MTPRPTFTTIVIIFSLAIAAWAGRVASAEPPLRMALIPYLSPNVLIPLFQPLAQHFEKDLGRPVELYSAPNIRSHVQRIIKPEFDIVFTAPHMGRLAQLDAGYIPIGAFERPLKGIVTVRKNGPIDRIEQLKGRSVAINDRLVLNSILVLRELEAHGLKAADLNIVPAASQNSALLSVAAGDVDAAVTVNFALGQIPKDQQNALHVLLQADASATTHGTLILTSPALAAKMSEALRASLLRFGQTPEGKRFLAASSYNDVVPINPVFVKNLDIYVQELRRLLTASPAD